MKDSERNINNNNNNNNNKMSNQQQQVHGKLIVTIYPIVDNNNHGKSNINNNNNNINQHKKYNSNEKKVHKETNTNQLLSTPINPVLKHSIDSNQFKKTSKKQRETVSSCNNQSLFIGVDDEIKSECTTIDLYYNNHDFEESDTGTTAITTGTPGGGGDGTTATTTIASSNNNNNNNKNDKNDKNDNIQFQLKRDSNENMVTTMQRLDMTLQKQIMKKYNNNKKERGSNINNKKIKEQQEKQKQKPLPNKKKQQLKQQKSSLSNNSNDKNITIHVFDNNNKNTNNQKMEWNHNQLLNVNHMEFWKNIYNDCHQKGISDDRITSSKNKKIIMMITFNNNNNQEQQQQENAADDNQYSYYFELQLFLPTIISVHTFEDMESKLFIDIPIAIEIDTLYTSSCNVDWYVNGIIQQSSLALTCTKSSSSSISDHISSSKTYNSYYIPTESDVNHILEVVITPMNHYHDDDNNNHEQAYRFMYHIEALPENIMLRIRQNWLQQQCPNDDDMHRNDDDSINYNNNNNLILNNDYNITVNDTYRIMSYNVLAHQNAMPKKCVPVPFYPYVSTDILAKERRLPLIVHEILTHKCDVVCLQEVDELMYSTLYEPVLRIVGNYQSYYTGKVGGGYEGCAIFWSLNRFQSVSKEHQKSYPIKDLTHYVHKAHDDNDETKMEKETNDITTCSICENDDSVVEGIKEQHSDWKPTLLQMKQIFQRRPDLLHIMKTKLGQIVQIVPLQTMNGNNTIIVANTHLFFHPIASHIRLLQMLLISRQLEQEMLNANTKLIVYGGDMNSSIHHAACKILVDRHVPQNFHDNQRHYNQYQYNYNKNQNNNDDDNEQINCIDEQQLHVKVLDDTELIPTAGMNEIEFEQQQVQEYDFDFPHLSLPTSFPTMVSAINPIPEFTHFIEMFRATCDYIFISSSSSSSSATDSNTNGSSTNNKTPDPYLKSLRTAPMPTLDDVNKNVAMPSANIPSDHVSIVCDVAIVGGKKSKTIKNYMI